MLNEQELSIFWRYPVSLEDKKARKENVTRIF